MFSKYGATRAAANMDAQAQDMGLPMRTLVVPCLTSITQKDPHVVMVSWVDENGEYTHGTCRLTDSRECTAYMRGVQAMNLATLKRERGRKLSATEPTESAPEYGTLAEWAKGSKLAILKAALEAGEARIFDTGHTDDDGNPIDGVSYLGMSCYAYELPLNLTGYESVHEQVKAAHESAAEAVQRDHEAHPWSPWDYITASRDSLGHGGRGR